MSKGLMLGWLVGWSGVCICEHVSVYCAHMHRLVCLFSYVFALRVCICV